MTCQSGVDLAPFLEQVQDFLALGIPGEAPALAHRIHGGVDGAQEEGCGRGRRAPGKAAADIDRAGVGVDRLGEAVPGFTEDARRDPSVGFDLQVEGPFPFPPLVVQPQGLRQPSVVNQLHPVEGDSGSAR